jgi:hypothetical protein
MVFFFALSFGFIFLGFTIALSASKELKRLNPNPRAWFDGATGVETPEKHEQLFNNF